MAVLVCTLTSTCEEALMIDDNGFETFKIESGEHRSLTRYEAFTGAGIYITTIFDESAIYTLKETSDQADINKLIGFSDCFRSHKKASARIGWRWLDNELQILAYTYRSGERYYELMGSVPINREINLGIEIENEQYIFSGDGLQTVTLERTSPCAVGDNYWLWPYFGGNQTAPTEILIKLKREQIP